MAQTPKRHWLRAALACAAGGCAFAVGLLARNSPLERAFATGALIAVLAFVPVVALAVFFDRLEKWQFSLRAMLVAMTLVAVLLGLAAATFRFW